jgi:ubiquinone/menaquinone biosynthesis C-methylase UbiE
MLMQAMTKQGELDAKGEIQCGKVKFVQADYLNGLPQYADGHFDCVVDTMTLSSAYDRTNQIQEMKRLCKSGGYVLLMERGASWLPLINMWLKFRAARDLMTMGAVEHLDFEELVAK